jgi:hypothetical protein
MMKNNFQSFIDEISGLDGLSVIQSESEPTTWVLFSCDSEHSVAFMTALVDEISNDSIVKMMPMTHPIDQEKTAYQLVFHDQKEKQIKIFSAKIRKYVELSKMPKYDSSGIPDLSLVTIKQISKELKRRKNLTFAFVWMEDNSKDNISIEGNGNPTHLVGLLARGLHMAIEWSDKHLKFKDKDD